MPVTLSSKSKKRNGKIDADQELITTSVKRFKITAEAEASWRKQALEDVKFSIGTGQWDEAVKANREIEGKPCLTINRAPAFLRQYTGEERQHRPAMLVSPVGSGADLEIAKIHQGVLRHIEVVSRADTVYDSSYDWMMRTGCCPWRIRMDYITERSFEQEPRIEAIENPFAYYGSPVRRPDGTDPLWGHVIRDYSKEEYESEFGKTELVKLHFPTEMGNNEPDWVTKNGVRVAEYWWIDLEKKHIWLLDDGTVVDEEPADKGTVVDDRDTVYRKVNCVVHDAIQKLKTYKHLGKYIPFPEVNGVRLNVNGKIYKAGMIRDYRDAQRIYDFMVTRAVEQVDMVSKDPLWVPDVNAQWESDYRQMNRKNFSHLYYKTHDENGNQLPPPTRAGREAPIQAMREIIQQADYDMKAVIGIYGPSLGEEAGTAQESGVAILSRKEQSDAGAISWHDQLNQAIVWQGLILLDLWPKYINAARVQRIINPDDSVKHQVVFNSQYSDPEDAQKMLNAELGLKKVYDVGTGDYDITLSSGPMAQTARKEAFRALSAVIAESPEIMLPVVGDIWAKNADFADSDVLADRLKKLVPPQMQDANSDDLQTQLAQKDAALKALSDQHNQLVAELNRASDTIRTKRLELESRERIALANNETQLLIQQLKDHAAGSQAHLEAQLGGITQRLEALHSSMSIDQEAGGAPNTPELPDSVEPKARPITPAAPTPRPQPIGPM